MQSFTSIFIPNARGSGRLPLKTARSGAAQPRLMGAQGALAPAYGRAMRPTVTDRSARHRPQTHLPGRAPGPIKRATKCYNDLLCYIAWRHRYAFISVATEHDDGAPAACFVAADMEALPLWSELFNIMGRYSTASSLDGGGERGRAALDRSAFL